MEHFTNLIQDTANFNAKDDLCRPNGGNYYQLERLGLNKVTIAKYADQISYSKSRQIPVFIYRDIDGRINRFQYFSTSFYKDYPINDTGSYFYLPPILPHRLITKVIMCPSPIELLSFHQLRKIDGQNWVLLSIHPRTHVHRFKEIQERFPNAKFISIHSNESPYNQIRHLSMDLAVAKVNHTISFLNGDVTIKLKHREYRCELSNFSRAFVDQVKQHIRFKVKHSPPVKPFLSYNEILNYNNGKTT